MADQTPPEQAQTNAQAVLDIREKTDAMTDTGWRRAKQLADGEKLSKDVIQKMAQFNRHQSNTEFDNFSDVPESRKGEDAENPWWEDNGTVAWFGWGGTAGIEWAIEQSENMDTNSVDTFESGIGVLQSEAIAEKSPPFTVSGVALPVNQVVNGGRNVDHFFPPNVLERAADLLEGTKIVKNFHELEGQAPADDVIGEVTSAGFQDGVGLVFEGKVSDEDIAEKIQHGFLDVSPSVARTLGEMNENMGARAVENIGGFRDVAVVAEGQPGAEVNLGSNPAVTALSVYAMDSVTMSDTTEKTDEQVDTYKEVAGVEFTDTAEGKLDESKIPSEGFESHYLYPGDTKSDSTYPVVDADGNLRKGNVNSAWELGCRGKCPSEEEHDENLMALAEEFDNPPEFAQEENMDTESGGVVITTDSNGETVKLIE